MNSSLTNFIRENQFGISFIKDFKWNTVGVCWPRTDYIPARYVRADGCCEIDTLLLFGLRSFPERIRSWLVFGKYPVQISGGIPPWCYSCFYLVPPCKYPSFQILSMNHSSFYHRILCSLAQGLRQMRWISGQSKNWVTHPAPKVI
jgi:hypothetical protein